MRAGPRPPTVGPGEEPAGTGPAAGDGPQGRSTGTEHGTAGPHPGWARLDLELRVDERHGRGLAERLGALVEVRDVAELRAYTA